MRRMIPREDRPARPKPAPGAERPRLGLRYGEQPEPPQDTGA